jgi:ubiquitin-protein ligase
MSTVRLRRLKADSDRLHEYVRRHPRVRLIQAEGDPPERYQLEYRIKSLQMVGGELKPALSHVVEVALPRNYPRTPPQCRMLSPVFHPNIAPHAICVGDHWGAGESLESIVIRIGEMLAYQSYNVKSPLNGEAARWVEENRHQLPLDAVSLLPEDDQPSAPPKPSTASPAETTSAKAVQRHAVAPAQPSAPVKAASSPRDSSPPGPNVEAAVPPSPQISVRCPKCAAGYQIPAAAHGRRARCVKCGQVFTCQAGGAPQQSNNVQGR